MGLVEQDFDSKFFCPHTNAKGTNWDTLWRTHIKKLRFNIDEKTKILGLLKAKWTRYDDHDESFVNEA